VVSVSTITNHFWIVFGLLLLAAFSAPWWVVSAAPSSQDPDWRSDWEVERGFNISIDAQGFQLPTSIAFVPNPGNSPKDPLYFVAELKGAVKVVTNDRSVFTFAEDFFTLSPELLTPGLLNEVGLAGICLDDKHGYVFATFGYHDLDNIQRNNIVRFQSKPGTFSLTATSQIEFTELFAPFRSTPSLQIGPCQVTDGLLYVNVGVGEQKEHSQQINSLQGKVLRMTLEGRPAPGNPFYIDDDIGNASNYVWALGLRNPFGLAIVEDRVFIADNGSIIDRFMEVSKGANYLWDGRALSTGTNADAIFIPSKGVAQMDFYSQESDVFPSRFKNTFFFSITGSPVFPAPGSPAIMTLQYDLGQSRASSVLRDFLVHRGSRIQVVAGLAFGPDGLYFATLFPNEAGMSAVLKVQFDPAADYPFILRDQLLATVLMNTYGCFTCHKLNNNQGGDVGPVLDRDLLVPRLETRLNSQEYAGAIKELELLDQEPFVSFGDARRTVEQAEGLEKIWLWLQYRIQEPRFDDPNAKMPGLGLTEAQARSIATYLSGFEEIRETVETVEEKKSIYRRVSTAE